MNWNNLEIPDNRYYQDSHRTLYNKDCRSMSELPDDYVQMVCTSPPFWGLRKYSGEQDLVWGDNHCEHEWLEIAPRRTRKSSDIVNLESKEATNRGNLGIELPFTNTCSLCNAWRGAFGLEPTPEMYVQHTIEILREIRRVLRKDGVCFWNIGDSYAGSGRGADAKWQNPKLSAESLEVKPDWKLTTIKPKDLCLIPFRVSIAAQEDGWWVRSVIIWSKPNPMPESVKDRPTESHEYLLMLTQNAGKSLYWTHRDGDGTRERPKADYRWVNRITKDEVAIAPLNWKEKIVCQDCEGTGNVDKVIGWYVEEDKCSACSGKGKTTLWRRINLWQGHDYYWDQEAVREPYSPTERWGGDKYLGAVKGDGALESAGLDRERSCFPNSGRNLRTVWEFPTFPYPHAHFAVFPEKLPELCIKAATPEVGCCSKCGAPWERIIEVRGETARDRLNKKGMAGYGNAQDGNPQGLDHLGGHKITRETKTLGWQPTCKCNADKVPSIVLDPFAGSGTTLEVAAKLGRKSIGYEISEEYCKLAVERNKQQVLI